MTDPFTFALTPEVCRLLGVAGFLAYVANYAALSLRFLTSECMTYFAGNTLAATLVLISLSTDFNLASALIQGFWICIGLLAIALRLRGRVRLAQ
jgi:hypothetical protein